MKSTPTMSTTTLPRAAGDSGKRQPDLLGPENVEPPTKVTFLAALQNWPPKSEMIISMMDCAPSIASRHV